MRAAALDNRQDILDIVSSRYVDLFDMLNRFIVNNDIDTVRYLLNNGIDPNITHMFGKSILLYMFMYGNPNPEMVRLFLNAGADKDTRDPDDYTLLARASQRNNIDLMRVLIEAFGSKCSNEEWRYRYYTFDGCIPAWTYRNCTPPPPRS